MKKIKLSKNFYKKSSIEDAIKNIEDISGEIKEDEGHYYVFSHDEELLLELSNYLLASK